MASIDVKLDDASLAQIVGLQILESMGAEARDKLVKDAIVALNKVPDRGYGRDKPLSPLQEAFNDAAVRIVNQLVRELVETSEVKASIKAAVDQFVTLFPQDWNDTDLQTQIMATIVAQMRADRDAI